MRFFEAELRFDNVLRRVNRHADEVLRQFNLARTVALVIGERLVIGGGEELQYTAVARDRHE